MRRIDVAYQMTVLYNHPEDPEAFDAHYDSVHAPLAAKLPGLRGYTVVRPVARGDERPPYHLIATLTFDDEASAKAALASEEGRKAVADLANFAQAGAITLVGPVTTVV
ncbi:MAG: EthD family reductase [Actinomycetes bacterium]|jgi:uncharacterized protein (TIGR02118 family)